ncbi:MAG: aminotransferase class V-fold PLP-dependent enzyme [Planctomycetes bacterium]|nr:aminotransferase class V-fold PLP-dependent enzyme [Planctomycetota bacterium]
MLETLPAGPLTREIIDTHIRPLFLRVLKRDEIYLANHSLGRPLDQLAADMQRFVDPWYADMDDCWGPWLAEQNHFRASIASLLGLSRADCVVPKTSAGQGLRAVLNACREDEPQIVATRGEFDSCDFILKTYRVRGRAAVAFVEPDASGMIHADAVIESISPKTSLVLLSQIFYSTGQVLEEIPRICARAHECGAVVILDCYHSFGVIPIDIAALGIDFAIGGSYKYTRGGPGACWLAISPEIVDRGHARLAPTLDTGWFAKLDAFAYQRPEIPHRAAGGDSWLESTPPIATMYQARSGLDFTRAIGIDRLRAHNLAQQARLAQLLSDAGIPILDHQPRGAFLRVPHADTNVLVQRLKTNKVNTDTRLGTVRLCPDILTTDEELVRAVAIIKACL